MALSGKYLKIDMPVGSQYIPLFTAVSDMAYDDDSIMIEVDGDRYYAAITNDVEKRSCAYVQEGNSRKYLALWAGKEYYSNISPPAADIVHRIDPYGYNKSMAKYFPALYEDMTDVPSPWNIYSTNFKAGLSISGFFKDCRCLKQIRYDYSNFTHDITSYSSNDFSSLFENCESLVTAPKGLKLNNASDVRRMFANCVKLKNVTFGAAYFERSVYLDYMFYECKSIENITLSFNSSYTYAYTGQGCVRSATHMFDGCENLKEISTNSGKGIYAEDLTAVFKDCKKLEAVHAKQFNPLIATNMESTFENCESLRADNFTYVATSNDQRNWLGTTEKVTNFKKAFKNCKLINTFAPELLKTDAATNMQEMFMGCESLPEVFPVTLNMSAMVSSDELNKFDDMFTGTPVTTVKITGCPSGALDSFVSSMKKDGSLTIQYV